MIVGRMYCINCLTKDFKEIICIYPKDNDGMNIYLSPYSVRFQPLILPANPPLTRVLRTGLAYQKAPIIKITLKLEIRSGRLSPNTRVS